MCAFISGVIVLGTPSYPAGRLENIKFYGDGYTVVKVDGTPKEVFTTAKHFQPLLLAAIIKKSKVQVHGDNCTKGRPFDEFSIFP